MRRRSAIAALALLVAGAPPAAAQAPFTTDDAGVTERRRSHLELFAQWADLPPAAAPATMQSTLVTDLGYGLARRLELGCDLPWIVIHNAGNDGDRVSGIGDLNVYLKWRAWEGAGGRPTIALVGAVELPTGDEDKRLGSGVVDTTFNTIAEWTAVGPIDLRANLGAVFRGNSLTGGVGLTSDGQICPGGLSATHEGDRRALGVELTGARAASGGARELRLQASGR